MNKVEVTASETRSLYLFVGEKSGDLHGSHLVNAIRLNNPLTQITGTSGPKMRESGVHGPLSMESFEVMGLTDVLLALPKLVRHFHTIRKYIISTKPDITVLIDYPGFNLRMAKSLRRRGYQGKIVQYVSPSVWAWGKERIHAMSSTLDMLLTIYPFESKCFQDGPLPVEFVGNPLKEYISNYDYDNFWKSKIDLPQEKPIIALFPGSRKGEISRNLPLMLESAFAFKQEYPEAILAISCGHHETAALVNSMLAKYPADKCSDCFLVPKECSYELMRDSRCAIAKSGTVTLELALHGCPTVVAYALTRLNRLYAKYILKLNLPYYCIVNILADKCIFPEFIETSPTKESLFNALKSIYIEGTERTEIIQACASIGESLGGVSASMRAANAIIGLMKC